MEEHINPPCCNNCDASIDNNPYVEDLEKRLKAAEKEAQRIRNGLLFIKDYPSATMGVVRIIKDLLK